jgi:hemolysin III
MSFLVALSQFREPVNAWSHGLWLVLSVPATMLLWRRCVGDPAKRLSLLVFGLSLAFCYAGSTLFHAVRLPSIWISWFDKLDHVGIFVLIAGSYTPMAWNNLQGRMKWVTLASAWSLSALGTGLLLTIGVFPTLWSTCFYLAMGWGAAFCYLEMARILSHRALLPLLLGGILYSVGAVINLSQWPVLWPGVFGAHELFHLFVMAGSLAHFWFMLSVIAPASCCAATAARGQREPEVTFLDTLASGHGATALETIPNPCDLKGHCPPMYLHISPDWGRENGS